MIPAAEYAAGQRWLEVYEVQLRWGGQRFVKSGLPRSLSPADLWNPGLRRVGKFRGVYVFMEWGQELLNGVVYFSVSAGCDFQPYQDTADYGGVRG